MNLIKQQQTVLYLIKWVTVHNDFWLVSLTFNHCLPDWLCPDQIIYDILYLIFLNVNNIQHQQLKLLIQKKKKKKKKMKTQPQKFFFSCLKIKEGELSQ